jgi:septum formation protein
VLEVTDDAPQLVLASTSRYRKELLARLGVAFTARAPAFDERAFDDAFATREPEAFACALAAGKAAAVAAAVAREDPALRGAWVLGADQLAMLPGEPPVLLHKPGTVARAVDQLMQMSGRVHWLVNGVVLHEVATGRVLQGADRVVLRMRAFDRAEATAYVERWQPLDCGGSYRIEDAGIRLFEAIEGSADPTSITGLPLLVVARLLRAGGVLAL